MWLEKGLALGGNLDETVATNSVGGWNTKRKARAGEREKKRKANVRNRIVGFSSFFLFSKDWTHTARTKRNCSWETRPAVQGYKDVGAGRVLLCSWCIRVQQLRERGWAPPSRKKRWCVFLDRNIILGGRAVFLTESNRKKSRAWLNSFFLFLHLSVLCGIAEWGADTADRFTTYVSPSYFRGNTLSGRGARAQAYDSRPLHTSSPCLFAQARERFKKIKGK